MENWKNYYIRINNFIIYMLLVCELMDGDCDEGMAYSMCRLIVIILSMFSYFKYNGYRDLIILIIGAIMTVWGLIIIVNYIGACIISLSLFGTAWILSFIQIIIVHLIPKYYEPIKELNV